MLTMHCWFMSHGAVQKCKIGKELQNVKEMLLKLGTTDNMEM